MKLSIFGEYRLRVRKGEKKGHYSAIVRCTALDVVAEQAGRTACRSENLKLTGSTIVNYVEEWHGKICVAAF